MEKNDFIRVAIIDDHKILLEGLEHLINQSEVARVIDKAYNITDSREMLKRSQPEVVLLDVNLPDGSGIDFCSEIREHHPNVKILMLTTYAESAVISRALNGGASGYVLKNAMSEEMLEGICTVASGEQFLCDQAKGIFKTRTYKQASLSDREIEVLKLIVKGYTIKEIAEALFLSFETVRSYCKYLHLKLEVRNTASLVRLALEQKLV